MIYDKYMFTVGGNVATLYNQTTATQSHSIPRNKPFLIMKYDANANNQAAFDGITCEIDNDAEYTSAAHDYVYYSTAFSLTPNIATLTAASSVLLDKTSYQEIDNRMWSITQDGLIYPINPYEHYNVAIAYGYAIPKSAYSANDLYVYVYAKDITEIQSDYESLWWTVCQSGNNSASICYYADDDKSDLHNNRKHEFVNSTGYAYTNITAIDNFENNDALYNIRTPASTSAITFFNEFTQEYETSSVRVSNVNTQVIDHIHNTNSPYYMATNRGSISFYVRTYIERMESTTAAMSVYLPVFQYHKDATLQDMRTIALYDVNTSACYVKSCDNSNISAHDIQFSSVSNSTLKMSKHTYWPHPQVRDALPKNVYNSTISYSSNFNNSDLDSCNIVDSTVDLVSAYFYDAVQPASTITLTNLTANNSYINGTYYEAYTGDLTVNL